MVYFLDCESVTTATPFVASVKTKFVCDAIWQQAAYPRRTAGRAYRRLHNPKKLYTGVARDDA